MKSIEQLELLEELILDGTRLPFSSGRLVDEQEAIQVMNELRRLIPRELNLASDIVNNNNKYIESAKSEARNIIREAESQKLKLISSSSVKREADRQIAELKRAAESEYKSILKKASQKNIEMDKSYKEKQEALEKSFRSKLNSLNMEYEEKKNSMENALFQEHKRIKNQLSAELKVLNEEVHEQRQKKVILEKEIGENYNKSIIDIKNKYEEAKLYSEQILQSSKSEAESLRQDAYNYVNTVLEDLNNQVINISSLIINGKKYIKSNKNIHYNNRSSIRSRARRIIDKLHL